jgi:hypothetical protein
MIGTILIYYWFLIMGGGYVKLFECRWQKLQEGFHYRDRGRIGEQDAGWCVELLVSGVDRNSLVKEVRKLKSASVKPS